MPMTVLLSILACDMGPDTTTLLADTQVVMVRTDPPALGAGQIATMETLIVDPQERGLEVMQWTCTFAGEGCLEPQLAFEESDPWPGLVREDTGRFEGTLMASPALAEVLGPEPVPLMSVWTLACEPGLCPLFEAEGEALMEGLEDPAALLEELPIYGVSLSQRRIRVAGVPLQATNPTLSCEGPSEGVVEEEMAFSCTIEGEFEDQAAVYGYATSGGWQGQFVQILDGMVRVDYSYFPSEEPGPVDLYLVLQDGNGGSALWEATIDVQ